MEDASSMACQPEALEHVEHLARGMNGMDGENATVHRALGTGLADPLERLELLGTRTCVDAAEVQPYFADPAAARRHARRTGSILRIAASIVDPPGMQARSYAHVGTRAQDPFRPLGVVGADWRAEQRQAEGLGIARHDRGICDAVQMAVHVVQAIARRAVPGLRPARRGNHRLPAREPCSATPSLRTESAPTPVI